MSGSPRGFPWPTCLDGFARDVVWLVIKEIFRAILKQLGPKTPHGGDIDTWAWPLTDRLRRYTKSVRQVSFQAKKDHPGCGVTAKASLSKVEYWGGQVGLS